MNEEKTKIVANEENEKSKLDIAMDRFRRLEAKKQKVKDLEKKEAEKEAERKAAAAAKKKAKKELADAEKELKAVRDFAEIKKEPDNLRRQTAIKGFFEILNKFNAIDENGKSTHDFSDAYNFIGDSAWLYDEMKKCMTFNRELCWITIDGKKLREVVFAKKNEYEKKIENFKTQLEEKFEELKKLEEEEEAKKKVAEDEKQENPDSKPESSPVDVSDSDKNG